VEADAREAANAAPALRFVALPAEPDRWLRNCWVLPADGLRGCRLARARIRKSARWASAAPTLGQSLSAH